MFGCNNDRLFPEKYTGKDRISITKLEKGDHYYIQTQHKDLFSHYNLIQFLLLINNESHRKWVTLYAIQSFPWAPIPSSPYCGRQTPYGRDTKGAKCPAVGTNEEGKSPASRIVPNQHYSSVHSLYNRVVPLSAF